MKRMVPTALLGLAMLLTSCAGGLRGEAPPGAESTTAATAKAPDAGQATAPTGDERGIEMIRGLPGALAKAGGYSLEGTVRVKFTDVEHRLPFRFFRADDGRQRAEVTARKGTDLLVFDGQVLWGYSSETGRYASLPRQAGNASPPEDADSSGAGASAGSACPGFYARMANLQLHERVRVGLNGPENLDIGGQRFQCDVVEVKGELGATRLWLDRASGLVLRAEARMFLCGRTMPCLIEMVPSRLTPGGPADASLFVFTPPAGAAPEQVRVAGGPGPAQGAEGVTFVWKGEGASVALAGEFNGWNTSDDPMTKQADGSWTITKKLEPGRYMYKFVLDGGKTWKEDPGASESVDDGQGGKNSVFIVGVDGAAAPAVASAPATAAAMPAGNGKAPVQTPDGVVFTFAGAAASVALAGEFNAWAIDTDPLTKQADGTWTLTKKLEPGRYMYKFVLDGGKVWKEDPGASESVDDGQGGKNSVLIVGVDGAAAPAVASAPATAAAMPAGNGKAPVQTPDGVVFTFAGAAASVALAGDFNAWSINADPLAKQADGTWTLTKKLAAGAYEYKFVVDGTAWKMDEANPASKADPYGGKNSLVTVK